MQEIRGKLQEAAALGVSGRFAEMWVLSDELVRGTDDVALLLDIGALLSSYGFLTDARACYERAQAVAPTDLRAQTKGHPLCFSWKPSDKSTLTLQVAAQK